MCHEEVFEPSPIRRRLAPHRYVRLAGGAIEPQTFFQRELGRPPPFVAPLGNQVHLGGHGGGPDAAMRPAHLLRLPFEDCLHIFTALVRLDQRVLCRGFVRRIAQILSGRVHNNGIIHPEYGTMEVHKKYLCWILMRKLIVYIYIYDMVASNGIKLE